jgi:hypothetical protein
MEDCTRTPKSKHNAESEVTSVSADEDTCEVKSEVNAIYWQK